MLLPLVGMKMLKAMKQMCLSNSTIEVGQNQKKLQIFVILRCICTKLRNKTQIGIGPTFHFAMTGTDISAKFIATFVGSAVGQEDVEIQL